MSIIDDITTSVAEMTTTLNDVNTNVGLLDAKLDEIRAFIQGILAGGASTVELQTLLNSINAAKDLAGNIRNQSTAVLTEADALDEPATPPTP